MDPYDRITWADIARMEQAPPEDELDPGYATPEQEGTFTPCPSTPGHACGDEPCDGSEYGRYGEPVGRIQ